MNIGGVIQPIQFFSPFSHYFFFICIKLMSVFFYRASTVMVRNYKKLGTVPAKQYTPEELEEAVLQVQQGEPMRHVSRNFKIPQGNKHLIHQMKAAFLRIHFPP